MVFPLVVVCFFFCVGTLLTCTWLFCLSMCSLFKTFYKMSDLWRGESVKILEFGLLLILLVRSVTDNLFLDLLHRCRNFAVLFLPGCLFEHNFVVCCLELCFVHLL